MAGTILITGANGSLAIPAVEYVLRAYPQYTLILTVRNDSVQDQNTAELHRVLALEPDANVFIRVLDLASLEQVRAFSDKILSEVNGKPIPRLSAVICNAMTWSLSGGPKYSTDGYETSMAVNHLAHFSLRLRLLGGMDNLHGHIVFLGSVAHWPTKASLSKGYPTQIPDDMELLKKDTEAIRAMAVDPLDLINPRAFRQPHVPRHLQIMARILTWLLPLLRVLIPRLMKVEQAAGPVVEFAVADRYSGQEGYFEGEEKVESSPESMEVKTQLALWRKSVEWCGLEQGYTIVEL